MIVSASVRLLRRERMTTYRLISSQSETTSQPKRADERRSRRPDPLISEPHELLRSGELLLSDMHDVVIRVVAVLRGSTVEPDIFVRLELAAEERQGKERASALTGHKFSGRPDLDGRDVFSGRASH